MDGSDMIIILRIISQGSSSYIVLLESHRFMHRGLVRHLFTSRKRRCIRRSKRLCKVKVRLVEQVVNLVRFIAALFHCGKHPFSLSELSHRLSQKKGVIVLWPDGQPELEILHRVFNQLVVDFRTPRLPCIHLPLLFHLVEPLEVDWSTTHGTSGSGTLEIPALYTPRAKLMSAAQLAARTSLVAYGALHCLLKSHWTVQVLACTGRIFLYHAIEHIVLPSGASTSVDVSSSASRHAPLCLTYAA